ncbi:MAG: GxxExxY protein [Kiritimatiellae bacterium]|nr:GxxExxY protein [Kiritimatiellia bacterium]
MTEEEAMAICDRIRQIAYDLHVYLGTGYLEKVYENGLAHRMEMAGMEVLRQVPLCVQDEDGFVIGEYVADLIVNGIVVELKAVSTLLPAHVAQTINYLKAMKLEHGMLINFGSEKFQCRKLARRGQPYASSAFFAAKLESS